MIIAETTGTSSNLCMPHDERIFEKGDAGNAMFIVKTGEFRHHP